jgi:phenylacetaldehyde dehydrogenase
MRVTVGDSFSDGVSGRVRSPSVTRHLSGVDRRRVGRRDEGAPTPWSTRPPSRRWEAPEASVAEAEAAASRRRRRLPRVEPHHARAPGRTARPGRRPAVRAKVPDLVDLVQAETGATLRVAKTDAARRWPRCGSRRYARGATEELEIPLSPPRSPPPPRSPRGARWVRSSNVAPGGRGGLHHPYNFPVTNMAGKIGPALAMGNTVVVKPPTAGPARRDPLVEVLDEAGFPPGVVNVVTGEGPEAGRGHHQPPRRRHGQLHRLHRCRAGASARWPAGMKRLLLELGGKGAAIVFDDADLKNAISASHLECGPSTPARSAPRPPGWSPSAACTTSWWPAGRHGAAPEGGRPARARHGARPGHHRAHRDRVEGLIASAGAPRGPRSWSGGSGPTSTPASTWRPPCIADCHPRCRPQEFFGPVVVVCPSTTRTRPSPSPTTPSSASTTTCSRPTPAEGDGGGPKQLRTGNVGINTLQRNHEAAFGGFKMSGVGRDGGSFGCTPTASCSRSSGRSQRRR